MGVRLVLQVLLQRVKDYVQRVTDDAPVVEISPVKIRQQPKIAKVIHAIVAAKHEEGGQYYMVQYEGLSKEHDEWVFSPAVAAKHVAQVRKTPSYIYWPRSWANFSLL